MVMRQVAATAVPKFAKVKEAPCMICKSHSSYIERAVRSEGDKRQRPLFGKSFRFSPFGL